MKMKVFRFMSLKEFAALNSGEELVNTSDHRRCRTNSRGFCFLPSERVGYVEAMQFLPLSSTRDSIIVEFEAPENLLNKGYGLYADPDAYDGAISECDLMGKEEFSTETYSKDSFVPLRYGIIGGRYLWDIEWYPYY